MTTEPIACRRCHRALISPASRAVGIGPTCARREAVEGAFSTQQAADAAELVELGGVIPLRGRRVFVTIGHHGETYRTAATGQCNCPAGLVGRRCYHAAAVVLRKRTALPARRPAIAVPALAYLTAA